MAGLRVFTVSFTEEDVIMSGADVEVEAMATSSIRMMESEATSGAGESGADTNELRSAFRQLCVSYEDVVDEAAEMTPPVDERIGLALFKIDEATAVADVLRQDAAASHDALLNSLMENCRELEDIFIRVNLMESFVAKVHAATKELEGRMDTIAKASDPVFNTGGVTTLLRSLTIKRPNTEAVSVETKWEPIDLSLGASELMARLDASSAEQLGVSLMAPSTH